MIFVAGSVYYEYMCRILEIVYGEGLSDGGIVVEDCLLLLLNLLKENKSNQTLFVEGNYVSKLTEFFKVETLAADDGGWPAQKVYFPYCFSFFIS